MAEPRPDVAIGAVVVARVTLSQIAALPWWAFRRRREALRVIEDTCDIVLGDLLERR